VIYLCRIFYSVRLVTTVTEQGHLLLSKVFQALSQSTTSTAISELSRLFLPKLLEMH